MLSENLLPFLDKIPSEYKEAVCLYYLKNLSQKEIANHLKVSTYQTKKLISKGMYLLRSLARDPEIAKAKELLEKSKT